MCNLNDYTFSECCTTHNDLRSGSKKYSIVVWATEQGAD